MFCDDDPNLQVSRSISINSGHSIEWGRIDPQTSVTTANTTLNMEDTVSSKSQKSAIFKESALCVVVHSEKFNLIHPKLGKFISIELKLSLIQHLIQLNYVKTSLIM